MLFNMHVFSSAAFVYLWTRANMPGCYITSFACDTVHLNAVSTIGANPPGNMEMLTCERQNYLKMVKNMQYHCCTGINIHADMIIICSLI